LAGLRLVVSFRQGDLAEGLGVIWLHRWALPQFQTGGLDLKYLVSLGCGYIAVIARYLDSGSRTTSRQLVSPADA
jgi:hypothetical protein